MFMCRSGPGSCALMAASIAAVRVLVVSVGRLRAPYADDVQHYQRLLARYVRLELVEVRDEARRPLRGPEHPGSQASAPPDHLRRRLPPRAFVSLLDRGGETFDSLSFSRFIEERRRSGRDLCFVVGGPHGLDLDGVDHRFSLGALTLPHQLARVVVLEQVYRAHKILAREPYHY